MTRYVGPKTGLYMSVLAITNNAQPLDHPAGLYGNQFVLRRYSNCKRTRPKPVHNLYIIWKLRVFEVPYVSRLECRYTPNHVYKLYTATRAGTRIYMKAK